MFKQFLKLEVKGSNDRLYTLQLEGDSPLGEVIDALFIMRSVAIKQLNEQHEKDNPEACEEESKQEEGKE